MWTPKKRELVGAPYKNAGPQWRPAGEPVGVNVHNFLDPDLGKANPYGIYDFGANTGWVCVGTDHDTAAVVVATLRCRFHRIGKDVLPGADRLLVCAGGGSSG